MRKRPARGERGGVSVVLLILVSSLLSYPTLLLNVLPYVEAQEVEAEHLDPVVATIVIGPFLPSGASPMVVGNPALNDLGQVAYISSVYERVRWDGTSYSIQRVEVRLSLSGEIKTLLSSSELTGLGYVEAGEIRLNNAGTIAFTGTSSEPVEAEFWGGRGELFLLAGGAVSRVVRWGDPSPVGGWFYEVSLPGTDFSLSAGGAVVFGASVIDERFQTRYGIFRYSDGVISKVVMVGDSTPVGGIFTSLSTLPLGNYIFPLSGREEIVFHAFVEGADAREGLFLYHEGEVHALITIEDPFEGISWVTPLNNQGELLYSFMKNGEERVFLLRLSEGYGVEAIHEVKGISSRDIWEAGCQFNNRREVVAYERGALLLYRLSEQGEVVAVSRIVAVGDPTPVGYTFDYFGDIRLNSGGMVAFEGYWWDGEKTWRGVFLSLPDEVLHGWVMVEATDTAGVVTSFPLRRVAIDLNRVTDGVVNLLAGGYTDETGLYWFLTPEDLEQGSLTLTLRDMEGLVDVRDNSRDPDLAAWLRTQPFPIDGREVNFTMRIDSHNNVVYSLGAEASNTVQDRFAHLAAIYRYTYLAARFAVKELGLERRGVVVQAYTPGQWGPWGPWQSLNNLQVRERLYNIQTFYRPNTIHIDEVDSPYNEDSVVRQLQFWNPLTGQGLLVGVPDLRDRPDNREFHEYAHHIIYISPIGGVNAHPPLGPGNVNHGGLQNSHSGDSWHEGLAEFLSIVISDVMLSRAEKPIPTIYWSGEANPANLEDNYRLDDHRQPGRQPGGPEEFAIASLLWDLYDGVNLSEDDLVSISLEQIWGVFEERGPQLMTFRDVYFAFIRFSEETGAVRREDLQQLFVAHGFYNDIDGDGLYDIGEPVGATSWNPNFPNRGKRPLINGSFLIFNILEEDGPPVSDVVFNITVIYHPPFTERSLSYLLYSPGPSPHPFAVVAPPVPSQLVITALKEDYRCVEELTIDYDYYWESVNTLAPTPPEPFLLNHTLHLKVEVVPVLFMSSVSWEAHEFVVTVYSNSSIGELRFDQPLKQLSFRAEGVDGSLGFSNITIPLELMSGDFTVLIDDSPIEYASSSNQTHTALYFTYTHPARIKILSTHVIPEFSSPAFILLVALLITLSIGRILHRPRRTIPKNPLSG